MPALALKAAATLTTLATVALAAVYVSGHLRNPSAPLHPGVVATGGNARFAEVGGRLQLTPRVVGSDVQPVTSTYAS